MSKAGISAAVEAFIIQYIGSIGQLEILLLLQAHPDKKWTVADVGEEMRSSEFASVGPLEQLKSDGLVVKIDGSRPAYQYLPISKDSAHAVHELAQIYPQYRVAIITLIYNKPVNAIRSFADAFKIKKDG